MSPSTAECRSSLQTSGTKDQFTTPWLVHLSSNFIPICRNKWTLLYFAEILKIARESSASTITAPTQLLRPSTPSETHMDRPHGTWHQPSLSSVSETAKDSPHRNISAPPAKVSFVFFYIKHIVSLIYIGLCASIADSSRTRLATFPLNGYNFSSSPRPQIAMRFSTFFYLSGCIPVF